VHCRLLLLDGVLSVTVVGGSGVPHHPGSWCHCHPSHDPPHEQLLMRLGVGGASSVVVAAGSGIPCHSCSCAGVSLSFHSCSTPQAVAHEAGMVGVAVGSSSPGHGLIFCVGDGALCISVMASRGGCWCLPNGHPLPWVSWHPS